MSVYIVICATRWSYQCWRTFTVWQWCWSRQTLLTPAMQDWPCHALSRGPRNRRVLKSARSVTCFLTLVLSLYEAVDRWF